MGHHLVMLEIQASRQAMGWVYDPFEIPEDIQSAWDAKDQGAKAEADWINYFLNIKKSIEI